MRKMLYLAVVTAFLLAGESLWAQTPSGTLSAAAPGFSTPVGPPNGQPVDPTKNVLDTVLAAVTRINDVIALMAKREDDLRGAAEKLLHSLQEAETRRINDLRIADNKRSDDLRDAETRRTDQLAAQKSIADLELARVNKASVDSSALLLATAVRELKTDSSDRTAKLEQFANEQRGRTSGGNEVWALIGVVAMLVLVGVGLLYQARTKQAAPPNVPLSPETLEAILAAVARHRIADRAAGSS